MTYTKLVNGEPVEMSPQEIAERQAEEAAWLAGKADREWQAKMIATDSKVPRYVEDLIDGVSSALQASGVTLSAHIPDALLNAYAEKKTIRNQKPKG